MGRKRDAFISNLASARLALSPFSINGGSNRFRRLDANGTDFGIALLLTRGSLRCVGVAAGGVHGMVGARLWPTKAKMGVQVGGPW